MLTSGVSRTPFVCQCMWAHLELCPARQGWRPCGFSAPTLVQVSSHPGLLRRVQKNSPEFLKCLHQPMVCSSVSPKTPSVVAGARRSNAVTGAASSRALWGPSPKACGGWGGRDEEGSACRRGGTSQSGLGHAPSPPAAAVGWSGLGDRLTGSQSWGLACPGESPSALGLCPLYVGWGW